MEKIDLFCYSRGRTYDNADLQTYKTDRSTPPSIKVQMNEQLRTYFEVEVAQEQNQKVSIIYI